MIEALLAALVVSVIASYVLLERKDKRSLKAMDVLVEAHRLQLLGLLERQDREREAHRAEIQVFCNRLQAPQQAVMQSLVEQAEGVDETRPLTDEETAEEQERALAIERLEALEREGMASGWLQ